MKFLLVILILTLSTVYATTEWKTSSHSKLIPANGIQGFDFNVAANSIKFDITTDDYVDMYLIRASEFQKLKDGNPFDYLWQRTNTRSASGEYSVKSIISQTVLTVVVNKLTGRTTQATFKHQELLAVASGTWFTRNFNKAIPIDGLQGYDFNTASRSIKFDITSDEYVDMYLIRKSEWTNLSQGRPFNYLWSAMNTRSGSSTYSVTSVISNTVLTVVVNKRSGRVAQASFKHQELLSSGGGGPIDLTTIIIILCVIACICCCCCVGGGGGTIYSRRRRHGSYVVHHDHGGYGNSGGNSYSSGGNSGGNSYSSGGNSYSSGGNSGGNSYN